MVESGLTLNLGKLMRERLFGPNQFCSGSIVWTNTATGEKVSTIGYQAGLSEHDGWIRLHYTTTRWNGEKHASDYRIDLVTTPQPFGGWRWWFVCPRTGDRVAKLHLPQGALTFASRRVYRLGYRSQRETSRDRALNRAFKMRRRLGDDGGIGDPISKPKGMRWPTFDGAMAKIEAAEEIVDGHTWALLKRIAEG